MTRAPLIHGLVCIAVFAALLPAAAGTAPAAKTTVRVSPVDLGRLTAPLVDTFFVGSHDTRRKGACHRRWQCNGIDLFAGLRAPVRAPFSGYVTPSWNKLGGRTFTILSTDGTLQAYGAHMASFTSLAARYVDAGDQIGSVGTTGNAQGLAPHLHFAVARWSFSASRWKGVDPYNLLSVLPNG